MCAYISPVMKVWYQYWEPIDGVLVFQLAWLSIYWNNHRFIKNYQGGPIDNLTYVPVSVYHPRSESEYNSSYTVVMILSNFIIINNELMNKDTNVAPEQSPSIILDRKSALFIYRNYKNTKHTRNIFRRIHLVRNDE